MERADLDKALDRAARGFLRDVERRAKERRALETFLKKDPALGAVNAQKLAIRLHARGLRVPKEVR